ncbi:hypothetical protein ACIBO1_28665 [Micromonospora sp. NPDC049903]|uniref:tetratricopeptide repeat protein n=1 Tax=Micromonospora sp. NPDC049903 TaxID=3364276 RepID=UPI003793E03B
MLEHAYGATLLAALLQGNPIAGLGNDVTPREVRFQQGAVAPVDDLVAVGTCPAGSRSIYVGVRRTPTIAGGSPPFVALLVDYLRMIVDRETALDADYERLGLAVAAPHPGADQVAQLAFLARKRPDDASFRQLVFAARHTNRKVRARLDHLDGAVRSAAERGGLPIDGATGASALTWRLLKALRIIELRLEGDDPADVTNVVSRLVPLVGDAAQAVALWDRLLHLSAVYAQAAAVVTFDMLARDVSGIVRVPGPVSASVGVREEQVHERLRQLPAACGPRLLAAWSDDQNLAWRLISATTSAEDLPSKVLRQWQAHRPEWLDTAGWPVQLAAAELAASYGAYTLAADLFTSAARHGAPRRGMWLARAGMIYEENDNAIGVQRVIADLDTGPINEPIADAVIALLNGAPETAGQILQAWRPEQASEKTFRAVLLLRLSGPHDPREDFTRDMLDRGLHVLADALREHWVPGLAVARSRLLIIRARRGESPNWDADLREARALAIRARDERRTFRGDSAEAVALACQASMLLMDARDVLALGAPGRGALPVESGSPQVCEQVALAAIHLDDLELAHGCANRIVDASIRARIDGYLVSVGGGDPQPFWWRAAELADDDDEQRALALLALANVGVDGLTRFPDFAMAHPGEAAELQAIAEVASGRPSAAIGRLRERRRSSISAAMNLAVAYQKLGQIDDQVQTLRDAADCFNDPSLRHSAAEVLARTDRLAEAENELDALLASTAPQWGGRADALRLAVHLASRAGRLDRMCQLLDAVLQIEPDDGVSRWTLIRAHLQRGELSAAWRVLHQAPEPLEPSSPADAQAWVKMYRRRGHPADTIAGCLRLLRRFNDNESLASTVLINLMLPWSTPVELTNEVRAQIAAEIDRFFRRWPNSSGLRRIQTADHEQLRAEMINMARNDELQQEWRRLVHGLGRGDAPLGLLAVLARRSYAEICLCRADGVLPAHLPKRDEFTASANAARDAIDHDVAIDTAAISVLLALPDDIRAAAMARFSRVITADDVMLDALTAKDTLSLRGTASWRYDEQLDHLLLEETAEVEADRLASEACRLHDAVEALTRLTPPTDRMFGNHRSSALMAWSAPLDLAKARGTVLWSDDPWLRAVARDAGVPATSTLAVLQHMEAAGVITAETFEHCVRTLIKAGIGDLPLDEQRLFELAEDDNWKPAAVAGALARPATWAAPDRTFAFYARLIDQVQHHAAATLPSWIYAAAKGATLLARPAQATEIAAVLLATTIAVTTEQGHDVAHLVAATRQALVDTNHPDRVCCTDR